MNMNDTDSESDFDAVCRELAEELRTGELVMDDVEERKRELAAEYSLSKFPKHTDILDAVPFDKREELSKKIHRKPVRTQSGVSPVAIMTSPKMCPHGKCLYCPGGPASEFSSAQAYTGHEPAAARGQQNEYDPYGQVVLRLEQLRNIGHPVDKVELILMGGTMTSRSHDYQTWFVKRALQAMNEYDLSKPPNPSQESFAQPEEGWEYLEDVIARNETGDIRAVAVTFETKPDWCDIEQIDRMLNLGGTKTEIGVQTTYERINREMHRGHGSEASISANKTLRDSGFKVGFHMMPGQPGMTREMCIEDFNQIFTQPEWKPDYLKIYPTLVVKGTRVFDSWKRDEFDPLTTEEAAEIVAEIKPDIPRYTRLQRVQRDIPADFIDGGVQKSNLRQIAHNKMVENGEKCTCIRCREVGHHNDTPEQLELDVMEYEATSGKEFFISIEDFDKDILVGFCRLRFPDSPHRQELTDAAVIRELHVYGSEMSLSDSSIGTTFQHKGFGTQLMNKAEAIAHDSGYEKMSVISGIGAREYYRNKLGYHIDGPYMSKKIN